MSCSNAYAMPMSFGSLHGSPTNAALYGDGFGSNPGGNGFAPAAAAAGTTPIGTTISG